MVKICAVMPCYKRAKIAGRALKSISLFCKSITHAVVLYQPKTADPARYTVGNLRVAWHFRQQMYLTRARNAAAALAIEEFSPDLLLIMDDDIVMTRYSEIRPETIRLAMEPGTGVVALTRQMNKASRPVEEDIKGVCFYIGGGYLIQPEKFKAIDGFDVEESADEKDFCLRLYLEGYCNYRTRRSMAIHEQGKACTGGMYGLFHDSTGGLDNGPGDTKYGPDHPYLQTEPAALRYGSKKTDFKITGDEHRITSLAHETHKKNRDKLLLVPVLRESG